MYFQTSKGGVYSRLWEKIKLDMPESLCSVTTECMERLAADPLLAMIGTTVSINKCTQNQVQFQISSRETFLLRNACPISLMFWNKRNKPILLICGFWHLREMHCLGSQLVLAWVLRKSDFGPLACRLQAIQCMGIQWYRTWPRALLTLWTQ